MKCSWDNSPSFLLMVIKSYESYKEKYVPQKQIFDFLLLFLKKIGPSLIRHMWRRSFICLLYPKINLSWHLTQLRYLFPELKLSWSGTEVAASSLGWKPPTMQHCAETGWLITNTQSQSDSWNLSVFLAFLHLNANRWLKCATVGLSLSCCAEVEHWNQKNVHLLVICEVKFDHWYSCHEQTADSLRRDSQRTGCYCSSTSHYSEIEVKYQNWYKHATFPYPMLLLPTLCMLFYHLYTVSSSIHTSIVLYQ